MTPDDFKAWRKAMEMNQAQAGEALGLTRETIVNYEAGKRRDNGKPVVIPKTVALACLAIQHGLTLED
jgi:transcriptional regulator with XRE-family HTH domain